MMKTIQKYFLYLLVLLLGITGGCSDPFYADETFEDMELKKANGPKVELTEDEIAGILYTREEEKLAHDVYVRFYADYGHSIFLNISESEQQHMDAMLRMINFYGLDDPASELPGVFNDPILIQLYSDLMIMATDLTSALEVGVIIEETDIADITELIEQTEVKNLGQVYDHLAKGSEKHLASFNKVLDKLERKSDK